jgi:hypothetical protein
MVTNGLVAEDPGVTKEVRVGGKGSGDELLVKPSSRCHQSAVILRPDHSTEARRSGAQGPGPATPSQK